MNMFHLSTELVGLSFGFQGCFFLLDSFAFEPQTLSFGLTSGSRTTVEQISELSRTGSVVSNSRIRATHSPYRANRCARCSTQ
jgi:hypothetical protein